MLLNPPPNPLPISMPPPPLYLQKKERKKKEKHGDKRGGSLSISSQPRLLVFVVAGRPRGGPIRARRSTMREGMRACIPSVARRSGGWVGFGCMWVGVGGYRRVLETLTAPRLPPSPPQDTDAVEHHPLRHLISP